MLSLISASHELYRVSKNCYFTLNFYSALQPHFHIFDCSREIREAIFRTRALTRDSSVFREIPVFYSFPNVIIKINAVCVFDFFYAFGYFFPDENF